MWEEKKKNFFEKYYKYISVSISVVIIITVLLKSNPVLLGGDSKSEYDFSSYCIEGIGGLIKQNADNKLFSDDINNLLDENSNPLDFNGSEKIFSAMIDISKSKCRVVTKDRKGFRAFNIVLKKGFSYPLFYQIDDISEIETSQKDRG